MTADASILDQQDLDQQNNVGRAFSRSLAFHGVIVGGLALYGFLNAPGERFGAEDAGGPAVGVTAVDTIPLPSRGPENPVANDSRSEAPQEITKPAPKEAPEPEPEDAVAVLPKAPKSKQPLTLKQRLKDFDTIADNQLRSKAPQAASNPLFAPVSGAGQIGVTNSTLGTRFPAYAAQIREITRGKWRVQDVDPAVRTAPSVTIRFVLLKNGKATNIQLVRRSNVPTLDLSVQNAVEESVYPPLPPEYDKDSVPVEFTFELKR